MALREPIIVLLVKFAEGDLYNMDTDDISRPDLEQFKAELRHALETIAPRDLPPVMQALFRERIESVKRRRHY